MTKKQTTIDSVPELPDWLNARTWQAFREMRKKIKKPMTDYAEELILTKLARWKSEGHDPNSLLDDAIEHDWATANPEWSARLVAKGQQFGWTREQPEQPERRYMTSVQAKMTPEQWAASKQAKADAMASLRPKLRRVG
jgi:hypothetical protein